MSEFQIEMIARLFTREAIEKFYADPKNEAAFQEWLKEKNK